MTYSPIVLFVYNRPYHTEEVLKALNKNPEFQDSPFYIFCDGPKKEISEEDKEYIKNTRGVVNQQKYWSKETHIIESDENNGLANSIIKGVSQVCKKYGKVIVLEDDIITSKGFLSYMNSALEMYKNEEEVMHINGYLPKSPFQKNTFKESSFMSTHMSCWGWATWKDSWKKFNADTEFLLEQLNEKKLSKTLDLNGSFYGVKQLEMNKNGEIKTWAIKWAASILLQKSYCLNPSQSLVKNIGMDGSGVHSGKLVWDPFVTKVVHHITLKRISKLEYKEGNQYFEKFYKYVNVKGIRRFLIKLYFNVFK